MCIETYTLKPNSFPSNHFRWRSKHQTFTTCILLNRIESIWFLWTNLMRKKNLQFSLYSKLSTKKNEIKIYLVPSTRFQFFNLRIHKAVTVFTWPKYAEANTLMSRHCYLCVQSARGIKINWWDKWIGLYLCFHDTDDDDDDDIFLKWAYQRMLRAI